MSRLQWPTILWPWDDLKVSNVWDQWMKMFSWKIILY